MGKPTSRAKRKPAKGQGQEPLSRQLGERILALREARGWSLDALAKASSVSRSMLSEIERSTANPTLVVTWRIAKAFGLGISDLVEPSGGTPSIQVVRADDRAQVFRNERRHQVRTLSPLTLEKDIEFYEIRLPPKGDLTSQAHVMGTRELVVVASGEVKIDSGSDSQVLKAGDSALFRADLAHALVNTGSGEAVIYLVDVYR